jgi:hypothetical protein
MENYIQYRHILDEEYLDRVWSYIENEPKWEAPDTGKRLICDVPQNLMPDSKVYLDEFLSGLDDIERENFSNFFASDGGYTPDVKISKYEVGGEFSWHCDFFRDSEVEEGWKRVITCITYMNDDYEGGETEFYKACSIKPEKYKTLTFPSSMPYIHRGKEIISGTKFLLVTHIWVTL